MIVKLIVSILLILLIVLITRVNTINLESFRQCILPNKLIISSDVEVILRESLYVYEYPLSKFRKIIKENSIKNPNFLNKLNNLPIIKKGGYKYEIVHRRKNEMIIYRSGKYYGFHIQLNGKEVKVLGVINDYDILTEYMKREKKDLEMVKLMHLSDPVLFAYSKML
jgi:hypothetical protein